MSLQQHIAAHKASQATMVASTEDLDFGAVLTGPSPAVTIQPEPSHLHELRDTYQRLEADAEGEAAGEIKQTVTGLESIRDALEYSNARGGISAESACFAALAISTYNRRLGMESESLTTGLESAIDNPTGKMIISTEALTASIEGVDHVGREFFKRAGSTYYRAVIPTWSLVKLAGMGIEGLVQRASKIGTKSGATITVRARSIAEGDGPSKDVAASLQRATSTLSYLVKGFADDADAAFRANTTSVNRLFQSKEDDYGDMEYGGMSTEEIHHAMEQLLTRWRDPRIKLGDKLSTPLIGGYKLFDDHSLKYKGDYTPAKKFDELANHGYPTLIGWSSDNEVARDKVEIAALTPTQIVQIGKALQQTVKNFGFWASMAEKFAAQATVAGPTILTAVTVTAKVNRRYEDESRTAYSEVQNSDSAELATVKDALATSNRLRFHVAYDAGRILRKIIGVYKDLAKKSLKAYAVSSNESISLESNQRLQELRALRERLELPYMHKYQQRTASMKSSEDRKKVLAEIHAEMDRDPAYKAMERELNPLEGRGKSMEAFDQSVEAFDQASAVDGVTINETSADEPDQAPTSATTAPEGEVRTEKETVQDMAVFQQDLSGPVQDGKAQAELAEVQKDNVVDAPAPSAPEGGPGLESRQDIIKNGKALPYWYRPQV